MKEYDRDLSAREVAELIKDNPAPVIIEIGAHDGSTTEEFLIADPMCRVICYEPDPRPYTRLKERFHDHLRVAIRPWAIGSINGKIPWHASHGKAGHSDDWDYSGSIKKPTHHMERSPEITFDEGEVQCYRLDDCLDAAPEFAWIDVQGAQREVIEGGKRVLYQTPTIYIELHKVPEYEGEPDFGELCWLLPRHEPVARYAENILFRLRDE